MTVRVLQERPLAATVSIIQVRASGRPPFGDNAYSMADCLAALALCLAMEHLVHSPASTALSVVGGRGLHRAWGGSD